ncbi:MAG: hypothetical protein HYV09_10550 [Deltaproteobacteria bacterium]|nr:hypothetical protein [Deltaproteobacteria bacterium]
MAFIARWSIDVPFGKKDQLFAVLDEWNAWGDAHGWPQARLVVGSIGAPESRVEEEYRFDSLADLEAAWAKLSDPKVASFRDRIAPFIVPGSPRWEIFRVRGG